jgi:hypothetical protein
VQDLARFSPNNIEQAQKAGHKIKPLEEKK